MNEMIVKMNEMVMKIIKIFITCFLQSYNFLEHRLVSIHIKGMVNFCGNMFERVYGSDRKCVTPFPYAPFEHKSEQPTRCFLAMNALFRTKFKKTSGVLKEGCFTLTIEFEI